jgi:hypothetical protein
MPKVGGKRLISEATAQLRTMPNLNQIMWRVRGFVRQRRPTKWRPSLGIAMVLTFGLLAVSVTVFRVDWSYLRGFATAPEQASLITARPMVIDGDTVRWQGRIVRLIGFDAPETGDRARCQSERERGNRATARLRELVATGNLELELERCSCPQGMEGTNACNFGPFLWGLNDQRSRRCPNAHG